MCGRYTLFKLADLLELIPWLKVPADILRREGRYNVAPSQFMPVFATDEAKLAQWGFVPSWTAGKPKLRPINAKCETVATSGMFRNAFKKRRCLVPADGFYEWKGKTPPKRPYYLRMRDGKPFAFAGLLGAMAPGRRGAARYLHHHHHPREQADGTDSQPHARHRAVGSVPRMAGR